VDRAGGRIEVRNKLVGLDWLESDFQCTKACPAPRPFEFSIFGDVNQ
jgi:hypothetical protein